jgi:uncharacterized protein
MMSPTEFTPVSGLIGGTLIGLSSIVLMLSYGRTAGASSIFGGLFTREFNAEFSWRLIFIVGVLIGAAWSGLFFFDASSVSFNGSSATIVAGGVIVGVGTTLGGGCTSGHGICGISRLSPRSLTATIIFMAVALVTVFVTRHVLGT